MMKLRFFLMKFNAIRYEFASFSYLGVTSGSNGLLGKANTFGEEKRNEKFKKRNKPSSPLDFSN
jgi:hypothetical protein